MTSLPDPTGQVAAGVTGSPAGTSRRSARTGGQLVAATPPSQVAAFVVCALWLGLTGVRGIGTGLAVVSLLALALGIAVGLGTGLARWFVEVPGWLVALCTVAVVSVVLSMLGFRGVDLPRELSVVSGVFVLGLDWLYVSRLRAAVVLSGVFVVPLASGHEPWAVAFALAWFAGALITFWLLERDARAAVPRPATPAGSPAVADRPRASDLISLVVPALVVGAAAALVLGQPSCSAPSLGSAPHGPLTVPAGGGSGAGGGVSPGNGGQAGSGQAGGDSGGGSGSGSPGGLGSSGGSGSGSGARSGSAGGSAPSATGAARSPARHGIDWTLVGLVAALAVAVAAVIGLLGWWLTRTDRGAELGWAEALARRLEREGRRRGRPRHRDETILAYSAALGSNDGVLGDERLAPVGEVLSAALFGPAEAPPPTRAWAERAVDEVIAAHPAARRGRWRGRPHGA